MNPLHLSRQHIAIVLTIGIVMASIAFACRHLLQANLQKQSILIQNNANQLKTIEEQSEILRHKVSTLESQLTKMQQEFQQHKRQPIPWDKVSTSIVPVGVQWRETNGKTGHVWNGTGFGLAESEWIVSAAHVMKWARKEQESLSQKGLHAQVVIQLPDSTIADVTQIHAHPQYDSNEQNEPSFDIAVFSVSSSQSLTRLTLSQHSSIIGEAVFIPGFPVDANHIRYPKAAVEKFLPTVRQGNIERIVDIGRLDLSSNKNLLQLGIPLVGGFSGAPVINFNGEVVGVSTFATHRLLNAREEQGAKPSLGNTTRILDPSHVSFAVSASLIPELIASVTPANH